jgi:hypothetical protein
MPKRPSTKRSLSAAASVAFCTLALTASAVAQGAMQPSSGGMGGMDHGAMSNMQTDLSGTYQCKPNPDPCLWPGTSPSISQSGNKLQIKGDNGGLADATLTSPITISAGATFNSFGIVRPDKSIDWSDGTKWSKQ